MDSLARTGIPVVTVPSDLRIPPELEGVFIPPGPTEEIQRRMDALVLRFREMHIIGMHWMNKGYGVGSFTLDDIERHADELEEMFGSREGRILDGECTVVPPPKGFIEGKLDGESPAS